MAVSTTTTSARQPFFAYQAAPDLTAYQQLLQRQVDLTRDLTVAWTTAVARMSGAALAQNNWASWWSRPQQPAGGSQRWSAETPVRLTAVLPAQENASVHHAEPAPDLFDQLIDLMVDNDLSSTLDQRLAG